MEPSRTTRGLFAAHEQEHRDCHVRLTFRIPRAYWRRTTAESLIKGVAVICLIAGARMLRRRDG